MSKIKIKNFGPIKEGYQENDGWMDVKKVTVFIGNQGSGKSTVGKLVSTLSWIEKAMVKGLLRQDELNTYNRFIKRLTYQRIDNYIKPETHIEFEGKAYTFIFSGGYFSASKTPENGYLLPKIMYVPAERNFLSVVERPDKLKELPLSLFTFMDEYDRARNKFWEGLVLPINGTRFKYDRQNKIAHITDKDSGYDLRLSEASSGFQSTVSLYLVTKYLAEWLSQEENPAIKENSVEEQRRIEQEVKRIIENKQLSPDVRQEYLRQLSEKRKPACFINIVEEPEQNLFPQSQRNILNSLIEYANHAEGNRLIITTHSPYIINYLSIAIQGDELKKKINAKNQWQNLKERFEKIIPDKSSIPSTDVVVYELDENSGIITKLPNPEGIPSDKNYLNLSIREGNILFDSLLEIEEEI
jgi:predicted ATPase